MRKTSKAKKTNKTDTRYRGAVRLDIQLDEATAAALETIRGGKTRVAFVRGLILAKAKRAGVI